jgi:hypothetical protein
MTALSISRAAYAMLWLAVAGWKLLLVLVLLGDLDRRWPVAVFAFVMALATAWAAVQWRAWMSVGREWPRTGLPMAAVMLLLPLKVLSVEMGG